MARKVFISVLGFSNYNECIYSKDEYRSNSVRFIQEATLGYLTQQSEWTKNDSAYILLTEEAENANWIDNGQKNRTTGEYISCEGLCTRLQKMNLPFTVQTICHLPHGNNEKEIWDIFERTFNELQEGDELYFDLTHGFRYLPMLVMVLINYSKFLKNTIVKSITYGNFEARNKENEAPIIDLLPLSILQDWTYAAGQFLDSGNINRLIKLSKDKIAPILRETEGSNEEAKLLQSFIRKLDASVQDMQTCRGISLVEATNIGSLIQIIAQLQSTFIKPLNPVFEKIRTRFEGFVNEPNVKNGFIAAKWCLENGLYQQAITLLQENIVSMVCIEQGFDYKNKKERGLINRVFCIHENNMPEQNWEFPFGLNEEEIEQQKSLIKRLLNEKSIRCLSKSFSICTGIRNDFNHSGMTGNPSKSSKMKDNITEQVNQVMTLVYGK